MNPGSKPNPSPSQPGWTLLFAVCPSTEPDEYPIVIGGVSPPGTGGTAIGYDHEKSPDEPPACHDAVCDKLVREKSPLCDDGAANNATTTAPPGTPGGGVPGSPGDSDGDGEPTTAGTGGATACDGAGDADGNGSPDGDGSTASGCGCGVDAARGVGSGVVPDSFDRLEAVALDENMLEL